MRKIRIEVVANRRGHRGHEEHPTTTIGLTVQTATVQFVDQRTILLMGEAKT